MLLHLFDDEKVVNRTIELFEKAFPDNNIFICFLHSNFSKYVSPHKNLYFFKEGDWIDKNSLTKIDKVLIHYLSYQKIDFINYYLRPDIACYWLMWGGDLYNTHLVYEGFPIYYEPWYLGPKFLVYKFLSKFKIRIPSRKKMLSFIRDRITYFISDSDFEVAHKYISQYINGKQVKGFSYYSIDTILGPLKNERIQSDNIMIGNSASFTNNHTYAFKYLSNLDLKKKKVIMPLSYGGSEKYKQHVIKKGKEKFGGSCCPLLEFIPLDDYNQLMLSTGICVFANWRQEAFGNIVMGLYLGAKVFMSNRSPLFDYLKRKDLIIYELETIQQSDIDLQLSDSERINNRRIIEGMFSEETILNNVLKIWGN